MMFPIVTTLGFLCFSSIKCATIDPRIVGGTIVEDRSQFAYQALLRLYSSPRCGGSIIDSSHILTAAHCMVSNGNKLDATTLNVVTGNLKLYDAPNVYQVVEVYAHENYDSELFTADVAVLKIADTFGTWTDDVRPIKLATNFVTSGTCTVSGWGTTYSGGYSMNQDLLYVNVPVVDWNTCKEYYEEYLDNKMICAGTDGEDACQGDSGGPLVCDNELVGIVSFGDGCAVAPGVYAEVAKHIDWITDKLNSGNNDTEDTDLSTGPADNDPVTDSVTDSTTDPVTDSTTDLVTDSTINPVIEPKPEPLPIIGGSSTGQSFASSYSIIFNMLPAIYFMPKLLI